MPICLQGDIFQEALRNEYDLVVVFGHIGLNCLNLDWKHAQKHVDEWQGVRDPFRTYANSVSKITGNTKFWRFVAEEKNNGMTDQRLEEVFQTLVAWAGEQHCSRIITNGIKDIDHGFVPIENRRSVEKRVKFIDELMRSYEQDGFEITLISQNDAFIRNVPV